MHPTILHYQKGNILNTRPEAASRNKQDQEILEMIPKNSQRMISPNLAIFFKANVRRSTLSSLLSTITFLRNLSPLSAMITNECNKQSIFDPLVHEIRPLVWDFLSSYDVCVAFARLRPLPHLYRL